MSVYAESSALLAWLLGEPTAPGVRALLASAKRVVTSELALAECARVLIRAATTGALTDVTAAHLMARLDYAAQHWYVLGLGTEVWDRVRRPFPVEPVRTLDALHLASALWASSAEPDIVLLSLDGRVRENGRLLGLAVAPSD